MLFSVCAIRLSCVLLHGLLWCVDSVMCFVLLACCGMWLVGSGRYRLLDKLVALVGFIVYIDRRTVQ